MIDNMKDLKDIIRNRKVLTQNLFFDKIMKKPIGGTYSGLENKNNQTATSQNENEN